MNSVGVLLSVVSVASIVIACAAPSAHAQDGGKADSTEQGCTVDLRLPGTMKDIVSNVLLHSAKRPEAEVQAFLEDAQTRHATGEGLMKAAARRFKIDETTMAAEVESFRHINCSHGSSVVRQGGQQQNEHSGEAGGMGAGAALELSVFARDVAMHVILHELGHALVREFDLPILGNEEAMADAFATHYLTTHMPDRALDVLMARITSLMIEAGEVPRDRWPVTGEHASDARRAFQIAAWAIAADPAKYAALAHTVGMTEDDVSEAADYGSEVHRSWRRVLAPLMMPAGQRSTEARVIVEEGAIATSSAAELIPALESAITSFDWHSQVTISFVAGDGGASWSRGRRTITVNSQYLRRFVEQGRIAQLREGPAR